MQTQIEKGWLMRCAIAFTICILFSASLSFFNPPIASLGTQTEEQDRVVMRFLTGSTPDVVIVGSSLSAILLESYFENINIRNLALSGGSNLTGLKLLLQAPHLPKVVAVEVNLLDRPADLDLIHRHQKGVSWIRLTPVFRAAIASVMGRKLANQSRYNKAEVIRIMAKPLSTFDNSKIIERLVMGYNSWSGQSELTTNATDIAAALDELEHRGSRIVFFEAPLPRRISEARFWVSTRQTLKEKLASEKRALLDLSSDNPELRWDDAQHLDQRSALLTAQAMERSLVVYLNSTRVHMRQ